MSGEPYYTPGCRSTAQCVFPGRDHSRSGPGRRPAQKLLQYVPSPNAAPSTLSTGAFAQTVRDDKGSFRRGRQHELFGLMTGYYFIDDYRLDNPYPGQQGGANVPGFDALTLGRAQLWSFGSAKTFGQNTVNDFHVSLTHNANNVGEPHGGAGVTLASQGFVTGPGTPGIVVLAPQFEGVENLVFNTFTMGVTITGVNQTGDTLHLSDSVSKVLGRAHDEVRRPVPVLSRCGSSRTPRSTARSRSPAPKPDPTSPISCSACRATTSSRRAASSICATSTAACSRRTAGARGRT